MNTDPYHIMVHGHVVASVWEDEVSTLEKAERIAEDFARLHRGEEVLVYRGTRHVGTHIVFPGAGAQTTDKEDRPDAK